MPNFAAALREEVIRLARKELRTETAGLKKAVGRYQSEIATLKKTLVGGRATAFSATQGELASRSYQWVEWSATMPAFETMVAMPIVLNSQYEISFSSSPGNPHEH